MRILKAVQPNSARSSSEPVMDVMASAKSDVLCVKNKGPRAVIDELAKSFPTDHARECWIEEARLAAIIGSCARSKRETKCGMRCWIAFARSVLGLKGSVWPPSEEGLLAWSNTFRCAQTFANYLGYVRTGCLVVRVSTDSLNSEAVKRAKMGIAKRGHFGSRHRQFVQRELLIKIMRKALKLRDAAAAMFFLASYVFLLRGPSEGFPMRKGGVDEDAQLHQSVITFDKDKEEVCGSVVVRCFMLLHSVQVVLRLAKRKNMPQGSVIRRSCWCRQCKCSCPVHVLWNFFDAVPVGVTPFANLTNVANKLLKECCAKLRVPHAAEFVCHDFRRGHAKDLQQAGASLREILDAGQWRSPRFLKYLDMDSLEKDLVVSAHIAESSDEEA
jgi:hypothetical protein